MSSTPQTRLVNAGSQARVSQVHWAASGAHKLCLTRDHNGPHTSRRTRQRSCSQHQTLKGFACCGRGPMRSDETSSRMVTAGRSRHRGAQPRTTEKSRRLQRRESCGRKPVHSPGNCGNDRSPPRCGLTLGTEHGGAGSMTACRCRFDSTTRSQLP